MESIKVYYKPVGVGQTSYSVPHAQHKYLAYTNSNGNQHATGGGPSDLDGTLIQTKTAQLARVRENENTFEAIRRFRSDRYPMRFSLLSSIIYDHAFYSNILAHG